MEKHMERFEMTGEQRRVYVDMTQLHEAYMDAFFKSRAYRGGMHWKKAKGKEYLFRSLDRYGYGKSLGARSDETEAVYNDFHNRKQMISGRLRKLKERLRSQARFCKAARIARVPRVVTAILRHLEEHRLLGRNIQVVGTHALYAYEARAGIHLDKGLLATQDMDLLWDVRPKLRLWAAEGVDPEGLVDILHRADRSFELLGKAGFRAANEAGYMVDLIKPEPKSFAAKEKRRVGGDSDLTAAEIKNLQWLVSAPKFDQIVIGDDGFPARMIVPDPRAFALHKLWVSNRKNRPAVKKKRDRAQALAVCKLTLGYMPEFEFKKEELRMFPKDVVADGVQILEGAELPPGYE